MKTTVMAKQQRETAAVMDEAETMRRVVRYLLEYYKALDKMRQAGAQLVTTPSAQNEGEHLTDEE